MKPSRSRVQSGVGREIRRARIAAGLTPRELGLRVERSQSWVAGVERGAQRLLAAELIEIAGALGADPAELLAKALRLSRSRVRSGRR